MRVPSVASLRVKFSLRSIYYSVSYAPCRHDSFGNGSRSRPPADYTSREGGRHVPLNARGILQLLLDEP